MSNDSGKSAKTGKPGGFIVRLLDFIEWSGNKLPDPAVLFLIGLIVTWILSAWLSTMEFTEVKPGETDPVQVVNMLTLDKFAHFLSTMVEEFYKFPPLGIVLVAMLGVGVAEHSGFITACLKSMLNITPDKLLTPMLILVAIVSHTAADAGYVLVIPIGGVMFYAAGRHPLAGIAAAFAGVSGGFSANFIVSGIDPLLSSLTQTGVDLVNTDYVVNPLCNIIFTAISSILIIALGWFLTDRIVEPRLRGTEIDGDPEDIPKFDELTGRERMAMKVSLLSILACAVLLAVWAWPKTSELRDEFGSLTAYKNTVSDLGMAMTDGENGGVAVKAVTEDGLAAKQDVQVGDQLIRADDESPFASAFDYRVWLRDRNKFKESRFVFSRAGVERDVSIHAVETDKKTQKVKPVTMDVPGAPLMKMIVPLIFLFFVVPGLMHGYLSGNFKSHRDAIKGMTAAMHTMAYYLVLVFFAALFIAAFKNSGIGTLLALKGANFIKESGAPPAVTIMGIIFLSAVVNLLVGSASAKWAMLAPIFVPMLMYSGLSPELTQAAYRVGDSTTNIITPMMPYFPLVVVFCQRYVKESGIGTVAAMMLPYSVVFLICWTIFLLIYWAIGMPLGIPMDVGYQYVIDAAASPGA